MQKEHIIIIQKPNIIYLYSCNILAAISSFVCNCFIYSRFFSEYCAQ